MNQSTRAGLAMLALAVMSAIIVGSAAHTSIERLAVEQAQARVELHLDMLADALDASVRGAQSDVPAARGSPSLETTIGILIRAAALPGGRIYVVNERGDDLVHPSLDRGLATDVGRSSRLGDDFPALAAGAQAGQAGIQYVGLQQGSLQTVADRTGEQFGLGFRSVRLTDGNAIALIEALPDSTIQAPAIAARRATLDAALVACLVSIALAMASARWVTRPLRQMTTAVQSFARNETFSLPTAASGEIGILADASGRMAADITQQTLAEEKFRLAVESCPNGMVMVDSAGKIVLVNGEIERLFEYDREELIGQPIEILVPASLRGQHAAHRRTFVDQPETRQMGSGRDLLGRRKSGGEFPVEVGLNPISTEEGPLVLCVIVDITERKQAQEMFQLAVEACPSGMMTIDGHGSIVMANREIERLFGYGRGELISRPVDILVPEGLRARHRRHREDFNTWPETHSMGAGRDLMGLRKDGSEFAVEVGLNPIHIRDDELMVLCVVHNITERKRAEHLKNEFVATVSHELRTPLTSIAASLGLLAGSSAFTLPDPAKRLITIAHTNSQRLVRLINDILDIQKIESGEVTFDRKRIDVRSLVEQAIEASRSLAESHDVMLRLDETSVSADVDADADRLTQVVINLLSNAIKFSPPAAEVLVAVGRHDGSVRVSVRDHGPGIPESFKSRIFDKFAQADASDSRQKGGTGLGLSIVKQIVTRLDGEVGFSDAPGGGTIFHVDLRDVTHVTGAGDHAETEAAGTRLLICDDYSALANVLATQLAKVGFASDIALSGADVISKATTTRYAAILVDLQLPDCDGISLIRELRAQPQNRDTPIVVVSSDVRRGRDDLRSVSLNVLDWFQKPVDVHRLASLLEQSGSRTDIRRPHILHLDNDPEVLRVVAQEFSSTVYVTSVTTLGAAREALAANPFDFIVIDAELSAGFGHQLLSDPRNRDGDAIPVIAVTGSAASATCVAQIREALASKAGSVQGPASPTCRARAGHPFNKERSCR
jgi:PAS domain S-box-containing protein